MSRFHSEQQWTTVRVQTLQGWRELTEDDFDALRAIHHDREIRQRALRNRGRRNRKAESEELDV